MRRSLPFAVLVVLAGCGGVSAPSTVVDEPEPTPAFVSEEQPAAAHVKKRPEARYETAHVLRRTTLRSTAGGHVIARIGRKTEFGSPRVLGVVGQRDGWVRVIASERENGRDGWVRAGAVRLAGTNISIRVDRSARRLVLRRGKKVLRRMPIAVGRPGNETPLGRFAVTDRLRTSAPDSPYGCCAVALSGHQTKLEPGWPGGDRLAIHGTPNEETVGTEASLGCMRAYDADIRALMRRVPLGAPVFIRA
ncbi:MAG TPA: L,D-transpeptidase [Solirubrobacteraceae bacterium]|nr:L,D-transpeptidase [Solirubrobacteraceae bacterium]